MPVAMDNAGAAQHHLLTLMRMRCSSFHVSSLMRILNTQGLKLTEARMESNSGEAASFSCCISSALLPTSALASS